MIHKLTFYLTIVMLLFQDDLPHKLTFYLTVVMLLFHADLQVNVSPYYRYAAVPR